MRKEDRHKVIQLLVSKNVIRRQEDFVFLLKNAGIPVGQATVSRDIKEMNLVKTPHQKGGYYYTFSKKSQAISQNFSKLFKQSFIKIDLMERYLSIKTIPGNAPALAAFIEKLFSDKLFGVFPTNETIFIISYSEYAANRLKQDLLNYL